jgi:hypothetical protein
MINETTNTESEHPGDDRNDQKEDGLTKHVATPLDYVD